MSAGTMTSSRLVGVARWAAAQQRKRDVAVSVEYQRVGDAWEAAAAAACAGAATVEGTGVAALLDRAGLAARLAAYQGRLAG